MPPDAGDNIETPARLDRWLWFARFFKSRTRATAFCETGRIRLNGTPVAKAHQHIRPGDVLTFALAAQVRVIRVVALATRRGPAPKARGLYEDLTPPDSPPSGEGDARVGQRPSGSGRPTKSDRRQIDRLREP